MDAELKASIKEIISCHVGRDKAIKAKSIATYFGYEEDRVVRQAIEELIDEDFPICSTTEPPAGYFFPANVEEARQYSKALQKRAARIFIRRRNIIKNTALFYTPVIGEDKQVRMRL